MENLSTKTLFEELKNFDALDISDLVTIAQSVRLSQKLHTSGERDQHLKQITPRYQDLVRLSREVQAERYLRSFEQDESMLLLRTILQATFIQAKTSALRNIEIKKLVEFNLLI